MALTISQIVAASFPAVSKSKKAINQWGDSTLLDTMESMGMIEHVSFGPTLEVALDYRRNPGADFLATDLTPTSLTKTEILTAASYTPAQLSVPMTWSKGDDMMNPSENQKVALVKSLVINSLETHNNVIEEAIFATSTDGFLGVLTLIPTDGQSTVGGISAVTETWWRNNTNTYLADFSDIDAQLTESYNVAVKGSSGPKPGLLFSGAVPHAGFESTLTPMQRWGDQNFKSGALKLQFKNMPYVFSQFGGGNIYGVSSKGGLILKVSKEYYKDMGPEIPLQGAEGFTRSIYSGLQLVTGAKSRNFTVQSA